MVKIVLILLFLSQYGIYAQSISKIDSLQKLALSKTGQESLSLYFQLAEASQDSSLTMGYDYSRKALKLSSELKDTLSIAQAYVLMGFYEFLQNNMVDASKNFGEALNIYIKLHDQAGIAKVFLYKGLIAWRKGELNGALYNYNVSLKLYKSSKSKSGISKALNYIGLVYFRKGDYPLALKNLLSSLKLKKELGNKYEISLTLNNIAKFYNELKYYNKSILYGQKALELSKSLQNKYINGRALNNLGLGFAGLNQYSTALEYMKEAEKVKKSLNDKIGLGLIYQDMGKIYKVIGEPEKELINYNKSLRIREELNDNYGIASILINIAEMQIKNNANKNTFSLITRGKKIAEKLEAKDLLKEYYKLLAEFYKKKSSYKKAFSYFKKYSTLKDSIFNESNVKKIVNLDSKYQVEEIEKELKILKQNEKIQGLEIQKQEMWRNSLMIVSFVLLLFAGAVYSRSQLRKRASLLMAQKNEELTKLNQMLIRSEKELKELNATKDKFFSVVAHDLKNPFNSIFGFYNLLLEEFESLSNTEKLDYIKSMGNSINNSYSLLENLLQWSRSQMGQIKNNVTKFEVYTLVTSIINEMFFQSKNKKIKITKNCTNPLYAIADKFMVETVIRNLMTNAIKFTNANGEITLTAKNKDNSWIEISVEDTGIGIEKSTVEKLFELSDIESTLGTSKETGTGLGLIICKDFVNKIGGQISVESELGKGSKFAFTVPSEK